MRPMLVIVPDVVSKDCFEMMTAENERPVEALFPYGPYPPLRDRVRTRRSHRCLDHLYAFGGEHLVEAGGELRVAVSDQEPERPTLLGEISGEVPGNLGDKGAARLVCAQQAGAGWSATARQLNAERVCTAHSGARWRTMASVDGSGCCARARDLT